MLQANQIIVRLFHFGVRLTNDNRNNRLLFSEFNDLVNVPVVAR